MQPIAQIRVNQLSFAYQERLLFENVNISINAGELTQLVGSNGSGKTTLLKILAGVIIPEQQALSFNNTTENQIPENYQYQIRYIGHLPGLKKELTVDENLKFDALIYNQSLPIQLDSILNTWGLVGMRHILVNTLSFGQQRKLALLRLVCFPGKVWLLDEPFVGLDKSATHLLVNLLLDHVQNQGIVVLSSHQEVTTMGLKQPQIINL